MAEGEKRPQQAVCHRAGYETWELDLETRRKSEDLKLAKILFWPICFSGRLDWQVPRESLMELGTGIKQ